MVLPIALLVPVIVSLALYAWFRRLAARTAYWSRIAAVGLGIAALRIGSVVIGVYILEHDSGWWQIPAYALTMLGLPEGAFMRATWDASPRVLAQLGVLLLAGTILWVGTIALLAARRPA